MNRIRGWANAHGWIALIWAAVLGVSIWVRWPTMSYALLEAHAFRQTFTTIMIREYMSGGLFQLSPVPLFGPPWQLPTEFPLFQWLAALGGDLIGTTPQLAGRLTALMFFIATSLLAAYLATRWFSSAAGVVALVLMQFLPFAYQWGNAPLIEFAATTGALLAVTCLVKWLDGPRWWWVALATVAFGVAALIKVQTALAWAPVYACAGIVWVWPGWWRANLRRWVLVLPLVVAGLAAAVWTRFADAYKMRSAYTEWLSTSSLHDWYYGTVDQRLDIATWQMITGYSEAIVGSILVFSVLLITALFVWQRRSVTLALAAALPVAALVFTNVYYMHTYYQVAVLPALVIVMAAGIAGLVRLASGVPAKAAIAVVAVAVVLVSAWISDEGKVISERKVAGIYDFPIATEMAAVIPDGSGVVMVGCDWDSTYFYLSGTRGLMVRDDMLSRPIPTDWLRNDLRYLVTCRPDIDTAELFPSGTNLEPLSSDIFRIVLPTRLTGGA